MLTKDEALSIARAEAEREGWPWIEPVLATPESHGFDSPRGCWRFMTNARVLGGNVNVLVDAETGDIIQKGFVRR